MNEKIEELQQLCALWEKYCFPVVDKAVQERVSGIVRSPLNDQGSVFAQEFKKGECVGLEMANALPFTLLEQEKLNAEKGESSE